MSTPAFIVKKRKEKKAKLDAIKKENQAYEAAHAKAKKAFPAALKPALDAKKVTYVSKGFEIDPKNREGLGLGRKIISAKGNIDFKFSAGSDEYILVCHFGKTGAMEWVRIQNKKTRQAVDFKPADLPKTMVTQLNGLTAMEYMTEMADQTATVAKEVVKGKKIFDKGGKGTADGWKLDGTGNPFAKVVDKAGVQIALKGEDLMLVKIYLHSLGSARRTEYGDYNQLYSYYGDYGDYGDYGADYGDYGDSHQSINYMNDYGTYDAYVGEHYIGHAERFELFIPIFIGICMIGVMCACLSGLFCGAFGFFVMKQTQADKAHEHEIQVHVSDGQ